MKNIAVLKKFTSYLLGLLLGGVLFYGIASFAKAFFGDPSYGVIGILGIFLIWFTWTMSVSQVESEMREAEWAKEKAKRMDVKVKV